MAIGPFLATTQMPIEGTACNSGSSLTTAWLPAAAAISSNLWICQTSAGTPTLTVTAEYTIFDVSTNGAGTQVVRGPAITGVATNSRASIAVGSTSSVASWVHIDTPSELDYPYRWVRFNIAVSSANATGIWFAVCANGL